jgi:hypothetical protein
VIQEKIVTFSRIGIKRLIDSRFQSCQLPSLTYLGLERLTLFSDMREHRKSGDHFFA